MSSRVGVLLLLRKQMHVGHRMQKSCGFFILRCKPERETGKKERGLIWLGYLCGLQLTTCC
jgi:hypothetical protein